MPIGVRMLFPEFLSTNSSVSSIICHTNTFDLLVHGAKPSHKLVMTLACRAIAKLQHYSLGSHYELIGNVISRKTHRFAGNVIMNERPPVGWFLEIHFYSDDRYLRMTDKAGNITPVNIMTLLRLTDFVNKLGLPEVG